MSTGTSENVLPPCLEESCPSYRMNPKWPDSASGKGHEESSCTTTQQDWCRTSCSSSRARLTLVIWSSWRDPERQKEVITKWPILLWNHSRSWKNLRYQETAVFKHFGNHEVKGIFENQKRQHKMNWKFGKKVGSFCWFENHDQDSCNFPICESFSTRKNKFTATDELPDTKNAVFFLLHFYSDWDHLGIDKKGASGTENNSS